MDNSNQNDDFHRKLIEAIEKSVQERLEAQFDYKFKDIQTKLLANSTTQGGNDQSNQLQELMVDFKDLEAINKNQEIKINNLETQFSSISKQNITLKEEVEFLKEKINYLSGIVSDMHKDPDLVKFVKIEHKPEVCEVDIKKLGDITPCDYVNGISLFQKDSFFGHNDSITAMLVLDHNKIVTASSDMSLIIWEYPKGHIKSLKKHNSYVTSVVKVSSNNIIASASWDMTVIFWDIKSASLIRALDIKDPIVTLVSYIDNYIVLGTSEGKVKKFILSMALENKENNNQIMSKENNPMNVRLMDGFEAKEYFGNNWKEDIEGISCMTVFDKQTVFIGTWNGSLISWNLNHDKVNNTSYICDSISTLLKLSQDRIAIGSSEGSIIVYNIFNMSSEKILAGHTSGVNSIIQFSEGVLTSVSLDDNVIFWDYENEKEIRRLKCNTEGAQSLVFQGNRLYTGGKNGVIRIFE